MKTRFLKLQTLKTELNLKFSGLKDRTSLIAELERRGESCDGTVKELKQNWKHICWRNNVFTKVKEKGATLSI